MNREHPTGTERKSLTQECGWKGGDRGGLAEWEQIHGKKKAKVCLSTGLLRKGSKQGMLGVDRAGDRRC